MPLEESPNKKVGSCIDTGNSLTATLSSGETWTGTFVNVLDFASYTYMSNN